MIWPRDKRELFDLGHHRLLTFCEENGITPPPVQIVTPQEWDFSVCAYYRPKKGVMICLELCAHSCSEGPNTRNWNWPGSAIDRTPYGVLPHEIGHHCDWIVSECKRAYYGDASTKARLESGEPPITSYCDGDHEWYAEMFRVFVTNPDLLRQIRPRTYEILTSCWSPIQPINPWLDVLGSNIPRRVVQSLRRKGAK